ncbi:MAG: DUF805 domain-containing protein [Dokdonella sp.]
MDWYVGVLKQYFAFEGRARRKEYWMFTLINVIISIVLMGVDHVLGTLSATSGIGLLGGIYALAVLLPSLAVSVRRLHDTDRSGWWLLICLVPLIGGIVLLVFMCLEGTRGTNRFGADPKAIA